MIACSPAAWSADPSPARWQDLMPTADHLAAHGAGDAEILRALRTDAAARGIAVLDRVLDAIAVRAACMAGEPCDCLEDPAPAGQTPDVRTPGGRAPCGQTPDGHAPEEPAPGGPSPPPRPSRRPDIGQFVRVPADILRDWWPRLGAAEKDVLIYIIARTIGFDKETDAISLSQFTAGVPGLDGGAGCSRRSAICALHSLAERRLITVEHRTGHRSADLAPIYGLNPARPRVHLLHPPGANAAPHPAGRPEEDGA